MKQEILTYLSTLKEELVELKTYIHNNPEESFHESKCTNYIVNLLKSHNFEVKEHFLDIPTSFFAQMGTGHPKICFLCDYDASPSNGDILGNSLTSTMSIGAAIGLSKVIPKTGGSVIVIGCPGELIGGSKNIMARQNTFEDIDAVLQARPYNTTAETGTSMAMLPIEIDYNTPLDKSLDSSNYSVLDACLINFNALNTFIKGVNCNCHINGVKITSSDSLNLTNDIVTAKFYVKCCSMAKISPIQTKIKSFVENSSALMNINSEIHFHQLPCDELIPSKTLSRIFSHNLKESGIITISPPINTDISLSLGNVSKIVPCISPYIDITNDTSIKPYSKEFIDCIPSNFAMDSIFKALSALSLTGLDLIERQSLLSEAKQDLKKCCK